MFTAFRVWSEVFPGSAKTMRQASRRARQPLLLSCFSLLDGQVRLQDLEELGTQVRDRQQAGLQKHLLSTVCRRYWRIMLHLHVAYAFASCYVLGCFCPETTASLGTLSFGHFGNMTNSEGLSWCRFFSRSTHRPRSLRRNRAVRDGWWMIDGWMA